MVDKVSSKLAHNLSLHDGHNPKKSTAKGQQWVTSQYQNNFLPLEVGMRTFLWKEGFDHRVVRKKNGFNHFKLEWNAPTDRTIGKSKGKILMESVERRRYHSAPEVENFENLTLPPSKLEKKRERLMKIYKKKSAKERERKLQEAKVSSTTEVEKKAKDILEGKSPSGGGRNWVAAQYEKNKQFNMKSNIDLEPPMTFSSLSSRSRDTPRSSKDISASHKPTMGSSSKPHSL